MVASVKTKLYLATAEGLVVISGADGKWHGKVCLQGTQLQCVAVSPDHLPVIYCGAFGQGVLASRDEGKTWMASPALASARVTALAFSREGALYAGTEPSAVYRSLDAGETWQELSSLLRLKSASTWSFPPRPETHHVQSILPDVDQPHRLHVAIEAGALLLSDDGGQTWRDRVPSGPADTHTLISSSRASGQMFSAAGDGCFESKDGGDSWQPLTEGLEQTYCWSVAINANNPQTVLLSASEHAYTAHSKHVARSFIYRKVGDAPWRFAMEGLDALPQSRIPVIAAAPLEPGTFYLATDGVVYLSEDEGLRWEKLDVQWSGDVSCVRHSLSMAVSQAAL